MGFTGWPERAFTFYEGLEADNSKAYWSAHRAVYDADVVAPMEALLSELADEFGDGKLFRPYRDIRFSADKSPYKTAMGATLSRGGYIHLSADGLGVAVGYHMMAPDQLARYRQAVAEDVTGEELRRIIAEVEARGIDVVGEDPLKTAPRGYSKDHPRADLLRNKGLITWQEWPVEPWMHTAKAKARIAKHFHDSQPLQAWLDDRVGHSERG
ncbi:DUF2461 domain-containing protein [Actinospica sp.]|jgi:uncharacterized protein (TIGR02453 family)|uniref:DUF2461 domain-containing protein n=1 Tax=Actinospica sp. TaxID=1872142 RepID=UPI002BABE51A|nr:DUF2461 domain-containing protein [Actinospica sp.]HWG24092.1 DUF2461 domain-containing protein [Actinospica sp.]